MKIREEFTKQNEHLLSEPGPDDSEINNTIELHELTHAIDMKKNTSSGDDQLHYSMFKHLTIKSLNVILRFINMIWNDGTLPTEWNTALVVPILKTGKDEHRPDSYRPISLTSHFCKIMETILTNRLSHYLETNDLLTIHQSGFRKNRSTIDQIIKLQNDIKKAKHQHKHLLAVFLDFEKAFDLMWTDGLLFKLKQFNITGKMFTWIKNFLQNRTMRVKINNTKSETFNFENGTPQGSVISPLLFNIMINDLNEQLTAGTSISQFADDSAIWMVDKNIKRLQKNIQHNINLIEEWTLKWGFKLSETKTTAMLFSRKMSKVNEINLTLNKTKNSF